MPESVRAAGPPAFSLFTQFTPNPMFTALILTILLLGLSLIATGNLCRVNRAAVAMFMAACLWTAYIAHGAHFVLSEHPIDFLAYLTQQTQVDTMTVKRFVADHIFLRYLVQASELALFLLATMSIVEVLGNNECFELTRSWLRTRNPKLLLWLSIGLTFIISANLDNVTTVVLMLPMVHSVVSGQRERWVVGSAVVMAACLGGSLTVIGDVTTLCLWQRELVSATAYTCRVFLPLLSAVLLLGWLLGRMLPPRVTLVESGRAPYRGDDSLLPRRQSLTLLLIGLGGLWLVPTFHALTLLPPFVGALCVLALLWVTNELFNRRALRSDRMVRAQRPMALQYIGLQNILFIVGILLAFGAVGETGLFSRFFGWACRGQGLSWLTCVVGGCSGLIAACLGNLTTLLGAVQVFSDDAVRLHPDYASSFCPDGVFWPLLQLSTTLGGLLLPVGSMAGLSLLKMENVRLSWYLRHIAPKVLAAWVLALVVMYLTNV